LFSSQKSVSHYHSPCRSPSLTSRANRRSATSPRPCSISASSSRRCLPPTHPQTMPPMAQSTGKFLLLLSMPSLFFLLYQCRRTLPPFDFLSNINHGLIAYPHRSTQDSPSSSSSNSSSTAAAAATDQQRLSASRTGAYIANLAHSHVQHRHRSAQHAVSSHTTDMKAYLDDFDAIMAKHEK
jgi:hypothetical protein